MRKSKDILVGVVAILGRVLLCTVFLAAIVGVTAPDVRGFAQVIAARAAVAPGWILMAAVIVLIAGSFSIVVGYKARIAAAALLLFLVLTTYLFHGFTFWNVVNPQARHDHALYLMMNLSVMGAMLFIVVNGPGQMSFDGKR